MKITITLFSFIFLSSCASILNSPTQKLHLKTSEPAKIIINDDTLSKIAENHYVLIERNKNPLAITAISAGKSKTISVDSRNSFAYWLNLYPSTLFLGFLIDYDSPCRYSYPRTIYLNTKDSTGKFLKYIPLEAELTNKYILKITPWKTMTFINSGLELGLERKFSNIFSTQVSASYLFPNNIYDLDYDFKPQIRGFQLAIEEKLYYKSSAPVGPYLGGEFSYLRNRYHECWYFGVKDIYNNPNYAYDNYLDTFGIKKQTFSLNLKLGYQLVKKRVIMDFYGGIGIRYRIVSHFDRINPLDEMEMPIDFNLYYISILNGKFWTVSLPFNFRIGWTF